MVDTEQAGLVHLAVADEDLIVRRRGGCPTPQEWAALRQAQFGKSGSGWQNGNGASVQIGVVNRNGQIW